MRVYLASGFFNDRQLSKVSRMEEVLRKDHGLDVFSPREQQNKHLTFGSRLWRTTTFKNDVFNIDICDAVVAIYNEEDAGTMWELGYAYAKGKPCIVFHKDEEGAETPNLMITDSLRAYLTSWNEVINYDFKNMPAVDYNGEVI